MYFYRMKAPLQDAPNVELLLKSGRPGLIDRYSIVAALNRDLSKVKFNLPSRVPVDRKRPRTPVKPRMKKVSSSADNKPKPVTPKKTIQEVAEDTDIDDEVAAQGFIDESTGEQVYLIEKIIKYEPGYGYFVHWQGYPKSDRSWQLERDMPPGFAKEMKRARDRYKESLSELKALAPGQ
jgi:hypothetical protein